MSANIDIKTLLLKECITITKLAELISQSTGIKISRSSLSQKLVKNTLRYYELEAICKILNYKIEYKKL